MLLSIRWSFTSACYGQVHGQIHDQTQDEFHHRDYGHLQITMNMGLGCGPYSVWLQDVHSLDHEFEHEFHRECDDNYEFDETIKLSIGTDVSPSPINANKASDNTELVITISNDGEEKTDSSGSEVEEEEETSGSEQEDALEFAKEYPEEAEEYAKEHPDEANAVEYLEEVSDFKQAQAKGAEE